jgi:hypothetical protein
MSGETDTPPWEPDKAYFKVTLKGGKGYEATWVNIGAPTPGELRRALIGFFGWDAEEWADKPLSTMTFEATQVWHALTALGTTFPDARTVTNHRGTGSNASAAYAAAKEEAPPPDPKAVLLGQIDEQGDVTSLKRLYAENKAAFDGDEALMAAYKAKGKSLSSK